MATCHSVARSGCATLDHGGTLTHMLPIDHQGTISGPVPQALWDLFGWRELGIPVLAAAGDNELAIIGHMVPTGDMDR